MSISTNNNNNRNRKAQIWGLDLIIAISLFLAGILLVYTYALNFSNNAEEKINELLYNGNSISNIILSEGWPDNWNSTNVLSPGILNKNKINQTKLENLYNLSQEDYSRLKLLFNTRHDFYFYLSENLEIPNGTIEGIGKPGLNSSNIELVVSPDNIIRINRFTIYKEKPVSFYLYIWD